MKQSTLMEDRTAYALNALLERHYAIGRVIRFRHVQRGRQATCFEVLTAGHREYLLYLFGPQYHSRGLQNAMRSLEALDGQGFPAPRPQAAAGLAGEQRLVVDGPQGGHLVLTDLTTGRHIPAPQWTASDLSHLGLRLAWLHRLLAKLPQATAACRFLSEQVRQASTLALRHPQDHPMPDPRQVESLLHLLEARDADSDGVAHGGISPEAILLDADRQITGIVDWGLCRPGNPAEDVVDAFVYWCVKPDGMISHDEAQALLEAYGSLLPRPVGSWPDVVLGWCGRHLIDHYTGCRALPRGFGTILANPDALGAAISLCQSK